MNKTTQADQMISCYIGPKISPEQFIAEHFFLHLGKGNINAFDGHLHYILKTGECCLVRKNYLVRYNKQKVNEEFKKTVVLFDEVFLKQFQQKHHIKAGNMVNKNAIIRIKKNEPLGDFLQTLQRSYRQGTVSETIAGLQREELLLLLLNTEPDLVNILFNFSDPQMIDLESFMNRNFRFNVSVRRFAYLTGRSLTRYKYDFKKVFNNTPSRWLVQKRLHEAYFLMNKKGYTASQVYLEVGFENLSHFSYAFKKTFGFPPRELAERTGKS